MPHDLLFELRLESRHPNGVVVGVQLGPQDAVVVLDGVSLQIVGPKGDAVSARTVLPIAGELRQELRFAFELRTEDEEVPVGCRVVGVAWGPSRQYETSIPTDPFTELQLHMQALRRVGSWEGVELEPVSETERARVALLYPWIDDPRVPRVAGQLEVVEHEPDEEEAFEELVDDLGIDADAAEWLRDLMGEES